MIESVYHKIDLALNRLRPRDLAVEVRLNAFCRSLSEALRGMEIGAVARLSCLRLVRARIEKTQAMHRPHPLETIRAIVLEALQETPETAPLLQAHTVVPHAWTKQDARTPRRPSRAASYTGVEKRIKHQLVLEDFRHFTPCPTSRAADTFQSLDPRACRRHLRHMGRRPRGPEPPSTDHRGMSHV